MRGVAVAVPPPPAPLPRLRCPPAATADRCGGGGVSPHLAAAVRQQGPWTRPGPWRCLLCGQSSPAGGVPGFTSHYVIHHYPERHCA